MTLNAQASQGFRLGGVNDPLNLPLCTDEDEAIFGGFQAYDDETSWNYEAGMKVSRGGFTFNAAAFYNDIKDLQVTLDAGSCSSRISFNVPEAHASGIEFEFSATPMTGLEVSLAGSVVEAQFDSTVRDGSNNVIGGIEEGNRLASVPEFQVAATAAYYFPLDSWRHWPRGLCRRLAAARFEPLHPAERPGEQSAQLRLWPRLRRRDWRGNHHRRSRTRRLHPASTSTPVSKPTIGRSSST